MTEPVRTTDEQGRAMIVHENGLVQDAQSGRILAPSNKAIRTSEQGRELALRRWGMVAQAWIEGGRKLIEDGEDLPDIDKLTAKTARALSELLIDAIQDPKQVNRRAENIRLWLEVGNMMITKRGLEAVEREEPRSESESALAALTQIVALMREAIQPNKPADVINGEEIK